MATSLDPAKGQVPGSRLVLVPGSRLKLSLDPDMGGKTSLVPGTESVNRVVKRGVNVYSTVHSTVHKL